MRPLPTVKEAYTNLVLSAAYGVLAIQAIQIAVQSHQVLAAVYFLIHLLLAALFLVRHRTIARSPYPLGYAAAIVATFYVYFYAYTTPTGGRAGRLGAHLMLVGAVVCLLAVLSLGRNFGILPTYRGVETRLMYRIVRHPIYASYVIMDAGIVLGYTSWRNVALFALGLALIAIRVHYEELVLRQDEAYVAYTRRVRYRILPFVY